MSLLNLYLKISRKLSTGRLKRTPSPSSRLPQSSSSRQNRATRTTKEVFNRRRARRKAAMCWTQSVNHTVKCASSMLRSAKVLTSLTTTRARNCHKRAVLLKLGTTLEIMKSSPRMQVLPLPITPLTAPVKCQGVNLTYRIHLTMVSLLRKSEWPVLSSEMVETMS